MRTAVRTDDILGKLNDTNFFMQEKDKTVIDLIDAFSTFQAKLVLWKKKMLMGQRKMFPSLNELIKHTEDMRLDNDVNKRLLPTILCLFAVCL